MGRYGVTVNVHELYKMLIFELVRITIDDVNIGDRKIYIKEILCKCEYAGHGILWTISIQTK